jgi:quercetin dioxygenase-like cupin family protein
VSETVPGPGRSGKGQSSRADWGAIPKEHRYPGVTSQRYDSEQLTVIRYELSAGAQYPGHTHQDEQLVYVLDGRARFAVGSEPVPLERGDLIHVALGTPHGATAESPGVVFLTISPRRERGTEGRSLWT